MNATIEMVKPAFQISLTTIETLELGRLALIWGQIDQLLMLSISHLIAVDQEAGALIVKDMTTGQLVNLLRKNRKRIQGEAARNLAKDFCAEMGSLIELRNHVIHGVWGWYLPGKKPRKGKPGCFYTKNLHKPVFPSELNPAANKAANLSRKLYCIFCSIHGIKVPDDPPKYWFGQHDPYLPKGMRSREVGRPGRGRQS